MDTCSCLYKWVIGLLLTLIKNKNKWITLVQFDIVGYYCDGFINTFRRSLNIFELEHEDDLISIIFRRNAAAVMVRYTNHFI